MASYRVGLVANCAVWITSLLVQPSRAETISYTYDALGRLVTSSVCGGPNNGVGTTIGMDAAGSRTNYTTVTSGAGGCASPPPPPPPPPSSPPANQPPVANADATTAICYFSKVVNVISNDTDPEGNYPLSLVSVNDPGSDTTASVYSSSQILISAGWRGTTAFTYTVRDSLGATSTGRLTVTVDGNYNQCDANQ